MAGAAWNRPTTGSVVDPHALSILPGLSVQAHPLWLQLGVRLSRPLPALRTEELIHSKSLFPFEHVIDGPAQFMSENRECLGLAVLGCKLFHVSLSRWVASQKEY